MLITNQYHRDVIKRFHEIKAEDVKHTVQFINNSFPEYRDLSMQELCQEVCDIIGVELRINSTSDLIH